MNIRTRITDVAERLLAWKPDPVPRYRILRDVLRRPAGDGELVDAHGAMLRSRGAALLSRDQCRHGGWPRFHSMDSTARSVPTTESAVRRVLALGFLPGDELRGRAEVYLTRLLAGEEAWPEHEETNDRWPTGREMFVAATLAEISPRNPRLEPVYGKWLRIAEEAFSSGAYDPEDELRAHCRLTGATTMRGSYLVLGNRYAMVLLGRCQDRLSNSAERALLDWVWNDRGRLGYLDAPLARPPGRVAPAHVERWFRSQAILSPFRSWPGMAADTIERMWDMQVADGAWDFGPQAGLRLSESWRRRRNRSIDHSVHCLLLLGSVAR